MKPESGLTVYYDSAVVGSLVSGDDGRMKFSYSEGWRAGPGAFPLSASLPLSGGWDAGTTDHRFFANLLPEADARDTICGALGISRENNYELLKRIGGECAGALSIYPDDAALPGAGSYRKVTYDELLKLAQSRQPLSIMTSDGTLRLSLAGGQAKLPVYLKNDEFFVPQGTAASSHILKFEHPRFKNAPLNETFVTRVAAEVGLPAVTMAAHSRLSLSTRYDRFEDSLGVMRRLHQEDFCQALGLGYGQKYHAEGGPTIGQCAGVIDECSSQPAKDLETLLRWQAFNVLVGNCDGHGKNLSLVYGKLGAVLAPMYDLVCTKVYPALNKNLAMPVGGETDTGKIARSDWTDMAKELNVRPGVVFEVLDDLCSDLPRALGAARNTLAADHVNDGFLAQVSTVVTNQIRRSQTLLRPVQVQGAGLEVKTGGIGD